MSSFGDALKAVREVLLMGVRVDHLEKRIENVSDDIEGLAESVSALRDRVSRIEGIIEGAAMAAGRQSSLPRE